MFQDTNQAYIYFLLSSLLAQSEIICFYSDEFWISDGKHFPFQPVLHVTELLGSQCSQMQGYI